MKKNIFFLGHSRVLSPVFPNTTDFFSLVTKSVGLNDNVQNILVSRAFVLSALKFKDR